ncbi:MAG: hypothetical protein JRC87_08015 [Deltaproteobacteria bacterium]|nr:hypothetical protein [Deltaproteobacteria bacterium]MBW2659518.1 hypothetical protein [Deltaproteobacteria bacterium]
MPYTPQRTIKYIIVRSYFLILIAVAILISAYSWQILSLENKVVHLEEFHDLFDNILEIRRYEKNYLLHLGSDNFENITKYLQKIDQDIRRLDSTIIRIAGIKAKEDLVNTLAEYRKIFGDLSSGQPVAQEKVRSLGTSMLDFSEKLLLIKQQKIKKSLRWIMYGYIIVTGGFFLAIIYFFKRQVMRVLDCTYFLQQATKDLINDTFSPMDVEPGCKDEICTLIKAFNKMAVELGEKRDRRIQARKLAAIGTFSAGIAHELNNPLNNISLSADTLLEEFGELDDEDAKEILGDIIIQTDRASTIVKGLLDFSRVKGPSQTELNIKDVTSATLKLIANELDIHSVWIEDYIPEDLPSINGDFQNLQQVFLNLFINAMHAMPEGGLIYLEASREGEFIRINVGDTGNGIDSEHVDHIFDPFYTTKDVGKGTGLGLSTVYGILKKHGGHVEVKSRMNVGTTFSLFLPVAEDLQDEKSV